MLKNLFKSPKRQRLEEKVGMLQDRVCFLEDEYEAIGERLVANPGSNHDNNLWLWLMLIGCIGLVWFLAKHRILIVRE